MNRKQQEILNNKIGKTVLISIGINHYSTNNEFKDLNKCINDANEIYRVFEAISPLNLNKEKSIIMVSNKYKSDTTKNKIINSIKDVCNKVADDEKLILFFSGHGHELDNDNYVVPSDCGNVTKENLICVNDIVNILENSKAKIKIVLLDSCCSGVIDKYSKGLNEYSFKTMKDYIESAKSTAIISACGKKEIATEESPNSTLSLFTTYLVEALEGKFEALDNGYLTINSLYEYVLRQMKKVSREYIQINQTPNINVKANSNAVIALYNYQLDNDDDDFDNYYEIKLNQERIEDPYNEVQKRGKVLLSDDLWYSTKLLLNELILNIFDHANSQNCSLQFCNNKIIISNDGKFFDPTKSLIESKKSSKERGNGRYIFNDYLEKNSNYIDINYEKEENLNKLIISFKNLKAFDIKGLCKVEVEKSWLRRYTEDDIILPEGKCKKYYYIIDMLSPCMSIAASAINTILSVIPRESKLVVIDKNKKYIHLSSDNYRPNPRIIYRDK